MPIGWWFCSARTTARSAPSPRASGRRRADSVVGRTVHSCRSGPLRGAQSRHHHPGCGSRPLSRLRNDLDSVIAAGTMVESRRRSRPGGRDVDAAVSTCCIEGSALSKLAPKWSGKAGRQLPAEAGRCGGGRPLAVDVLLRRVDDLHRFSFGGGVVVDRYGAWARFGFGTARSPCTLPP